MKITIKRELTFGQLLQCLFEQLCELEDRYNVKHSRNISLYLTLTDGLGVEVVCRDWRGEEVTSMRTDGPYYSAAEHYEI